MACSLTLAQHDAQTTKNLLKPAAALNLLAESLDYQHAAPLLPEAQLAALERRLGDRSAQAAGDDDEDDVSDMEGVGETGETGDVTATDVSESSQHVRLRTYPFYELDQYVKCPRQYKYAQRFGLLDPQHDAVQRFHHYIASGRTALHSLRRDAPHAAWPEAEQQLDALWDAEGPTGHAYETFYRKSAWDILRDEWNLLSASESPLGADLELKLTATLKQCRVQVTVNRIMQPDPALGADAPVTLVRVHTGRPKSSDENDLDLLLYYLAFRQEHPTQPVRIALAYSRDTLALHEQGGVTTTETLTDVTEKVRKDAERYLAGKQSRLSKLDRAARGIERGAFAPHPSDDRCAACAFFTVCPADPEEQA